jgi:hypothetical protein
MPGTVTNPRVISAASVGIDWQSAEGVALAPPYTPKQFIVAQSLSRDPDPTYLRPNGTHGSIFERFDGDRIISQAFKREMKMWGSRFQLLPFLESVMSGSPVCSMANMTLSGAQAPNITALSFTGIRPHHNTRGPSTFPAAATTVYIDIVGGGFPLTVNFYRDALLTDLVASAVVAAAATPTPLVAAGGSGLTGSITLGVGAAAGVAFAFPQKIEFFFENQFTRFFRMFYEDGADIYVLSDCVVSDLKIESAENAEMSVTASIMGKRLAKVTGTNLVIPEPELDLVSYSHSELTLTKNPSAAVTPVVDNFSFHITNNVHQYIANSPTPQKLIKRGFVSLGGSLSGEACLETLGLVDDARANTDVAGGMIKMRADYALVIGTSKTFRLEMPVKVRPRLKEPGFSAELIEKVELDFDVLYDGVTTPLAVTVEL